MKRSQIHSYFLIDTGKGMPRWCQLSVVREGEPAWFDLKGRQVPWGEGRALAHVEGDNVNVTLTGVPDVVAEMERELAFRHLLDPWSVQGWLSPAGKFYGCAFFAHDELATALLRQTAWQLEESGFVRVHESSFRTGTGRRSVNARQAHVLREMGFEDAPDPGRRVGPEPDRRQAPPRHAVKAPWFSMPSPAMPVHDLRDLVSRMRGMPSLAPLFDGNEELVTETGGGNWDWIVLCGDLSIGGEDHSYLMEAPGLHLRKVSFDQVEVSHWPFDGLHVDPEALALIEQASLRRGPAMA